MPPEIVIVAAVASNGAIGRDGGLVWSEPADQRHFRTVTMGWPVIMGRRTWESLPSRFRPLPGRRNLVVSRDPAYAAPGAEVVTRRIGISNGLWKARKALISPGWAADACLDGLELAPGPLPCPDSARPDGSPRARWALISGLTLSSPPSSPHAGAAPPAAGARLRSPW